MALMISRTGFFLPFRKQSNAPMTEMRAGDAVANPAVSCVAEAFAEAARCDNLDFAVRRLSETPLPLSPRTDRSGANVMGAPAVRGDRNTKRAVDR
ncbi:hypothetical protein NKH95_01555 [Mesorhizobium sp. M0848]|uniref:hypothetical protein n=1 Tax=Mesorhizobium sp. M0848 TaxID=2957012 RepID=UPI00333C1727